MVSPQQADHCGCCGVSRDGKCPVTGQVQCQIRGDDEGTALELDIQTDLSVGDFCDMLWSWICGTLSRCWRHLLPGMFLGMVFMLLLMWSVELGGGFQ